MDQAVKRTPLYEVHRRLGARMTQFGGFEMPLQYRGIIPEHQTVRAAAGIFDLSHMGEFELRGKGATALLELALTNSAARLAENQGQYTIMCAADGGTLDDLIVYRLAGERYLLCVNAANIAADWAHIKEFERRDCELVDLSDETALIAIQGPRAEQIVTQASAAALAELRRFHTMRTVIAGADAIVARTGYTGEDGFEIFTAADRAVALFEGLLEAGRSHGLLPCGLGARDTLRMEAGLPLYGHELDRGTSPLEAGLGAFVKFGHDFIGERALAAQRAAGPPRRLVGLRTEDGKSIARQGYPIFHHDLQIGAITSGTFAPSFDRPLAMGYVSAAAELAHGEKAVVGIRDRRVSAEIMPLPFYRRAMKSK